MAFRSDDWIFETLFKLIDFERPFECSEIPDEYTVRRLLGIARLHGVLGMVLAKARESGLLTDELDSVSRRCWQAGVVQSLRVQQHSAELQRHFAGHELPAILIKGTDFAQHLYPNPQLRPTFDVDLLVPLDRWQDAVSIIEAHGHREKAEQPDLFLPEGVVGERSWIYQALSKIEVDLHWDLIHIPEFRNQASLQFWDLDSSWNAQGGVDLTHASRLIIAAVHAVYHHQFDRLLLLADLQLAARAVIRAGDARYVRALAERTGTRWALDLGLGITARLLGAQDIEDLRAEIMQLARARSARPLRIPEPLVGAARRNITTIRTSFSNEGRVFWRKWLLRLPSKPPPGWELRPT